MSLVSLFIPLALSLALSLSAVRTNTLTSSKCKIHSFHVRKKADILTFTAFMYLKTHIHSFQVLKNADSQLSCT